MRNKFKLILFCAIILVPFVAFSQEEDPLSPTNIVRLPEVLPPSPNASSLGEYGGIPLNKSTGRPNIEIPLLEVSTQNLKIPISLSYTTDGFKVNQIASRVGLGWSLNAGGVITRTVSDGIDELSSVPTIPQDFENSVDNLAVCNFLLSVDQGSFDYEDMQPDVFSFNFNGYYGEFIIRNNQIFFLDYSNLLIESEFTNNGQTIDGFSFRITTPDGVKYYFGGSSGTEYSASESFGFNCGRYKDFNIAPTAWYLRKIIHPNDDSIEFSYSIVNLDYKASISQSQSRRQKFSEVQAFGCWDHEIEELIPPMESSSTCIQRILNTGVRLESISTSSYSKVNFTYNTRQDLVGDYSVKDITLINQNTSEIIKKISMDYYSIDCNLFPNTWNASDAELKSRLFLKSIKNFDKNSSKSNDYIFEYNDIYNLPARLSYSCDHWGYYNGKNNQNLLYLDYPNINNLNTLYVLFDATADRNPDINYAQKGLLSKIIYPTGGYENIEYEQNGYQETVGGVTSEKYFGGLRVKRITKNSGLNPGSGDEVKRYYYTYLDDLDHSSATNLLVPQMEYLNLGTYKSTTTCGGSDCENSKADYYSLGSQSKYPLSLFNVSNICYPSVVESYGENFENGGVETHFDIEKNHPAYMLYGNDYMAFPALSNQLNGKIEFERYFKGTVNNFTPIKDVTYNYLVDNRVSQLFHGYVIRKNYFEPCYLSGDLGSGYFSVLKYDIPVMWSYLDIKITKEYDEGSGGLLNKQINFYHNSINNLSPSNIVSTNSIGQNLSLKIKYNDDYNSLPLPTWIQTLKDKNIKGIPVETIKIKKIQNVDFVIGGNINIYDDNDINIHFVYELKLEQPLVLSSFINSYVNTNGVFVFDNHYELANEFLSYDNFGNSLSRRVANDHTVSFIWDYQQSLPIAKCINSSYSNMAYTSFEADGKGNWSFSSIPEVNATAPTGTKAYNLSNGSLTKTISNNNEYIISYWRPTTLSALFITGTQSGYPISGSTINGWRYYEHKISGQTIATLTGVGLIDEVRLYPINAQMVTMTFEPLIGLTSQCVENNRITYYEYDAFNRLSII